MVDAGRDEFEIKQFLTERYGDFVLYKPRFESWNIVLWLAPVALVIIGFVALMRIVSKRMQLPIDEDAA